MLKPYKQWTILNDLIAYLYSVLVPRPMHLPLVVVEFKV